MSISTRAINIQAGATNWGQDLGKSKVFFLLLDHLFNNDKLAIHQYYDMSHSQMLGKFEYGLPAKF